jgi:uridylate kinase
MSQVEADQMGMLATVMNGIALKNLFHSIGLPAIHVSAYAIKGIAEPLPLSDCRGLLGEGRILIFSAGLGRPFFTTDTAAVSRSLEIGARLLVKGTKVDGVYSADPVKDPTAKRFSRLSYEDVISNRLQIMDQTAFTLAREYHLPIKVVNITDPTGLKTAIESPEIGTIIS